MGVFSEKASVDRSTCLCFLNGTLRCERPTCRLTFTEEFTAVLWRRSEVPDLTFSHPHASRFSHSCIVTSPYDKADGGRQNLLNPMPHHEITNSTADKGHFWWITPLTGSTSDSLLLNQDFLSIIQRFCIQGSSIPGPGHKQHCSTLGWRMIKSVRWRFGWFRRFC